MKDKGILIFDMDGVLVDVSGSYRETVRQTVRLFFKDCRACSELPDPLFSLSDLARIKQDGGLNNDWDLTHYVIQLLCSMLHIPPTAAADAWRQYRNSMSMLDISPLAHYLKTTPDPLYTLHSKHPRITQDLIRRFYEGDVGSGNIIKQIFQEIYLGKDLFQSTYGIDSQAFNGKGYIHKEKLLIEESILEAFSSLHVLGIATGRPHAEAVFPLQKFGIQNFFKALYTLDDCLRQEQRILQSRGRTKSLSKPHPFMLDAIGQKLGAQEYPCYYVGDMPDDMTAATRSKFPFHRIGITVSTSDKAHLAQKLFEAGADHVLEDFHALKALLEK